MVSCRPPLSRSSSSVSVSFGESMPMIIPRFSSLLLAAAAVVWWFVFQWLRHRSYLAHRHARVTPNTQHLAWIGSLGALIFAVLGVVCVALRKSL